MDIQRLVLKADATHTTVKSLAPEVLFRYSGEGMRAGTTLTVEAQPVYLKAAARQSGFPP
jgi:hypothetical protein